MTVTKHRLPSEWRTSNNFRALIGPKPKAAPILFTLQLQTTQHTDTQILHTLETPDTKEENSVEAVIKLVRSENRKPAQIQQVLRALEYVVEVPSIASCLSAAIELERARQEQPFSEHDRSTARCKRQLR